MRFVVATTDFAGLGFALRLQEEGHEVVLGVACRAHASLAPEQRSAFDRVGTGLVAREPLAALIERRRSLADAYWIWDFNHSSDENELLRSEGFRVFGGGRFADAMEHDRAACLDFVSRYGLQAPPSFRFERAAAAIEFCRANPNTAYVLKPDQGANFETFLPESADPAGANEELRTHLAARPPASGFILQEIKDGVEANVEVWFERGVPKFAFLSLECKRKYALDLGPLVGCSLDFVFTIPLESRAVAESVGKLVPAYREMRFSGFADANIIAGKDGVWFLEKCERFGYNSHPNLFWNLARRPTADLLASLVDGGFEPDFAEGFGASVTMFTKERVSEGEAVLYPAKLERQIYFYDVWRKDPDGPLLIAGFDAEGAVLIATAHGYTIPTAWEAVSKCAAEIRFPYRHYRPDGDSTNYASSPLRRYEALKAMGYI